MEAVLAAWLNQVEIYFSILQRKAISPADFADLEDLATRILDLPEPLQRRRNTLRLEVHPPRPQRLPNPPTTPRPHDVREASSLTLRNLERCPPVPLTSGPGSDESRSRCPGLADRRRALGEEHTRKVSQLHRLLLEFLPGGAKLDLSAAQAKALLAKVGPRDLVGKTRRRLAAELGHRPRAELHPSVPQWSPSTRRPSQALGQPVAELGVEVARGPEVTPGHEGGLEEPVASLHETLGLRVVRRQPLQRGSQGAGERPDRSACRLPRPMPDSLSQINRRCTRPSCCSSSHIPNSRSCVCLVGIMRPTGKPPVRRGNHQHRQQRLAGVLEWDLLGLLAHGSG